MAQYRMYWPPVTRNFKLIAGVLFTLWIASVLYVPLRMFVADNLLISSNAVFERGQVWTLLTYAFWHADFMHLLFNLLVLWMFGGELDNAWKSSRWWKFLALCTLGGSVVILLSQLVFQASHPTLGSSAAVMGVVAAYAWNHWNHKLNFMFFPMTGKTMLLVFIGIDVVMVVFGGEAISIAGHLGGMATGLLLASGLWKPARLKAMIRRKKQRRRLELLRRPPENRSKHSDKPN